jgi:hypothetical protein
LAPDRRLEGYHGVRSSFKAVSSAAALDAAPGQHVPIDSQRDRARHDVLSREG